MNAELTGELTADLAADVAGHLADDRAGQPSPAAAGISEPVAGGSSALSVHLSGTGGAPPVPPLKGERDTRSALDEDIAGLDLASISYLAVLNERWGLEKVDAIEFEYRCWLQCVRDYHGELLAPSYDCDLYWHQHILCLGLYLRQTTQLFGRPLLHWPFSGTRGAADAARQQARFLTSRRIIGDLMERVRSAQSTNLNEE